MLTYAESINIFSAQKGQLMDRGLKNAIEIEVVICEGSERKTVKVPLLILDNGSDEPKIVIHKGNLMQFGDLSTTAAHEGADCIVNKYGMEFPVTMRGMGQSEPPIVIERFVEPAQSQAAASAQAMNAIAAAAFKQSRQDREESERKKRLEEATRQAVAESFKRQRTGSPSNQPAANAD